MAILREKIKDCGVLWNRTREVFGYDHNTIRPRDKLIAKCTKCNQEMVLTYRSNKQLLKSIPKLTHRTCRKHSSETRAKLKAASQRYWQDPESRKIASQIIAGHWQDPEYKSAVLRGLIDSSSCIAWDTDTRQINARQLWSTPEYRNKLLSIMQSPEHRELKQKLCDDEQREANRQLMIEMWADDNYRNHMATTAFWSPQPSKLQRKLIPVFRELKLEYIEEFRIAWWHFDYCLPHISTLIEVQGEYWHNLPEVQARDRRKATYVKNNTNYKLIIVWENEFNDIFNLTNRIRQL